MRILQDIRYGFRLMLKKPGYTAIAVLALALGIGANSAIFSVVNAVLLRPLPVKDQDRLVWAQGGSISTGQIGGSISPPDFLDYREQNHVFEKFAALQAMTFTLTGDGEPQRVTAARVSSGFFETLGVSPINGRTFAAEEEQEGHNDVAILGHGLWLRRFGGDPQIIGKTLVLNGQSATVIGVMPEGFQFPREVELWTPIPFHTQQTSTRRFHFLRAIGRLKPGVTLELARADITAIARQLERQYPDSNTDYGMGLRLLPDQIIGEMRSTLLMLTVAVGFVLLIACANVANLSLARSATRAKEIAIRAALGASRVRVVRQLLTESVLLSLLGGGLGLLLALWGVDVLVALSPEGLPRMNEITIDPRVLGFTLIVSVLTGVLFGLAPALSASRTDLSEPLKEGGRSAGDTSSRHRLRSLLVIAEVALSLVLLVGAGLLMKSFLRLSRVETGFNPTNVITMQLALTRAKYPEPPQRAAFFHQLIERVKALPGVRTAGLISELPMSGQEQDTFFTIAGHPPAPRGSGDNNANSRIVSPDYFRAMSIPLIKGRFFTEQDRQGSPNVVLISESFASRFFPNEDPIGQRLTIDFGEPWVGEIVGVVGNIRHRSLAQQPYREMYLSDAQNPPFVFNLVARGESDPTQLVAAIKNEVKSLDKELPIYNVKTMEQRVSESAAQPRFRTLLLGIFASVALILAAVGLYGVTSYAVTQRTHEIGIRMALGAQAGDIFKMVIGQGMILVLIGMVIGTASAFAMTRIISSMLYEVSATDPVIFAGIALILAGVALLACYIPARRATRVDPMIALRYE